MADDYSPVLAGGFSAGEGSWLVRLHVHLTSDTVACMHLTGAMLACC